MRYLKKADMENKEFKRRFIGALRNVAGVRY